MAEFNPNIQNQQLPNVTSRGSLPPTAVAGLFEDLTRTGTAAVTGAERIIEHRIHEDAVSSADRVRNIFTGRDDLPRYLGGLAPPTDASPDDVETYRNRLRQLTQAYRTGTLQESHYWMLLDMESRRIRNRFPGHRREVDAIIQNVVGATPANRLVRELAEEARIAGGNAAQERRTLEREARQLGLPEALRLGSTNPPSDQELQIAITRAQRESRQVQEAIQRLDLRRRAGQVVAEDATREATRHLTTQFASIIDAASQAFGGAEGLQERLTRAMREPPNATTAAELESMWRQIRPQVESRFRAEISRFSGLIGNGEQVNNIVQEHMRRFDAMGEAITNQQWGYLGAIHRHLGRVREGDEVSVAENHQVLLRYRTLSNMMGNQLFAQLMLSNDPRATQINRNIIEALTHASNLGQIPGDGGRHRPTTLDRTVDDITRDTRLTPAERNRTLAETLRVATTALGNPASDEETIVRFARGLFTGNPGAALDNIANREEVYAQLSSANIAANMNRISAANPELYRSYREFVLGQFGRMTLRLANDLQNIQFSGGGLRQDPTTGLFSLTRGDLASGNRPITDDERRHVERMNHIISGITALMNGEGVAEEDRRRVLGTVMEQIGNRVNLNVTNRDGAATTMWDAITRFFHQAPGPHQALGLGDADAPRRNILPRHIAPFMDFIGSVESGRHGYTSAPTGVGSTERQRSNPELTGMTLEQVMEFQRGLLNEQRGRGISREYLQSAVGRFQINRQTLRDILVSDEFKAERERLGITTNSVFNEDTQNRLFVALLNQRGGLQDFLSGRITRQDFMNRVARIWAGSPTTADRSYYEGVGPNRTRPGASAALNRAIDEMIRLYGTTEREAAGPRDESRILPE